MDIHKKFGKEVRQKRKQKDMTQEDVMGVCKLSSRQLSNIEHGKTNPKLETIAKLANTLDLDLNILKNTQNEESAE